MHPFVPHKFVEGKTVSLASVRENAEHLYATAKALERKRYNHFIVVLQAFNTAQGDASDEAQFTIEASFPYKVEGAELHVFGGGGTGTEAITLTSNQAGWNTLSATANHDSSTTRVSDQKNQNIDVASGEAIFTISVPSVSSADVNAWAILHCVHDSITEQGVNLTAPPRPKEGDAYDVTEWNTWFSSFSSELATLSLAMSRRKHFEVYPVARNGAAGYQSFASLPPRQDNFDSAYLYYKITASGGQIDYSLVQDKDSSASTKFTGSQTTVTTSWERDTVSFTDASHAIDITDDSTVLDILEDGTGELKRAYLVMSGRAVA